MIDCRTTVEHKFRTRLRFRQYDVILTKEQSVLTKIKINLKKGTCKTKYSVLDYGVDLYFHGQKLAREIDENGHSDRNIDYGIKRQKVLEQELGCEFIRIDPDKEDFFIFLKLSMQYLDTLDNCLIN